ncbi:helix-turn-helix domain-containing protein [Priestia megaterium]|nr:helix-turn-helix domain-containing protein [Priestia megaterium]
MVKKTAFDLHIHINTLHYRLKQMKELTDIDPKSVKGITLFHLALSLLE